MDISKKIRQYADEHNFGKIEYVGITKNGIKVYSEVHEPDENGLYAPTGFPYLLLEDKDGNLSKQCGVESLSTLDEIISQQ